ncbi:unnamed protein product [Paramecium primaurelia]|uniref:Uncharacterized protein n=1 Tax=Paramecium primaurelia TaxID=5886 RepID=A0A8S1P7R5_PARPR|nr:unnamed protein product [Paramecium primaurelia]
MQSNCILKPLQLQPQKPLKPLAGMQQNLNEHFNNIKNIIPYQFVDKNSPNITICGLTPKITEQSLRLVCAEYGNVVKISLRAYYRDAQAQIIANVTYENAQSAQHAYIELQKKVENGFHFQLYYGGPSYQNKSKIVKIKLPNPQIRGIIDKIARQVVKEGIQCEQIIKQREINNNKYAFLFLQSEENEYYKWRVYSFQNGDDEKQWKQEPYYFNLNECIYIPPSIEVEEPPSFAKKELEKAQITTKNKKIQYQVLEDSDRLIFSQMLRDLNTQKHTIGKAMIFCIDHQDCPADLMLILEESLLNDSTWSMKLARLYLISDILNNCNHNFKSYIQWCLPKIFSNLDQLLPYKEKILKLLQCWREQNLFDQKYLKGLELSFLMKEQSIQIESISSQLYKEKLAHVDDEILDRICRIKGLCSQGSRDTLIQRLVQHKFYNRANPDVSLEQVSKFVQVYRYIVDKDQQTIISSQKQSFTTQIQMMQEFLKLIQKRYKNIISKEGEEIDAIDERIYEFNKHIEIQRAERNLYINIDGRELTEEDIRTIEDKKVQVVTNYELTYLQPKPPLPPVPTDPIEIEVQQYRDILFQSGLYDPFKIEEFSKSKRAQLIKADQIRKEREKQLLLKQQQEQREREREKEREREREREREKEKERERDKEKEREREREKEKERERERERQRHHNRSNKRSSASSESDKRNQKKKFDTKHDQKYDQKHDSKYYKRRSRSRSNSRKKKTQNKKR